MEAESGRDIKRQVRVMHSVRPPQRGHGVKEDMLQIDGEVEQDDGGYDCDPRRQRDQMKEAPSAGVGSELTLFLPRLDTNTIHDPARASRSREGSAAPTNALRVADVDAGTAAVKVTLNASHGTLTLARLTGLTFSVGDGTADSHGGRLRGKGAATAPRYAPRAGRQGRGGQRRSWFEPPEGAS